MKKISMLFLFYIGSMAPLKSYQCCECWCGWFEEVGYRCVYDWQTQPSACILWYEFGRAYCRSDPHEDCSHYYEEE